MRKTILGLLVIVLAFIAPTIWERIMNQAPEWAWRGVFALFIVGGTAFVLLSDPVYLRIRVPFEYPFVSTAIIATAAAVCFGGLWYLVVMPTMQARQIADTTSA